ncbi:MAG: hypothetical protein ACLPSL_07955 [Smithella sp.]
MNLRRAIDEEVVSICGEMTMAAKMVKLGDGRQACTPCSQTEGSKQNI